MGSWKLMLWTTLSHGEAAAAMANNADIFMVMPAGSTFHGACQQRASENYEFIVSLVFICHCGKFATLPGTCLDALWTEPHPTKLALKGFSILIVYRAIF